MNERNLFLKCEDWRFNRCKNGLKKGLNGNLEDMISSGYKVNGNGKWDSICENCDIALEIYQRICPVYLNRRLKILDIAYYEVDAIGIYNYECMECNRKLYK